MLLIAPIFKVFLDICLEIIIHQNEVPLRSELQDLNHGIKQQQFLSIAFLSSSGICKTARIIRSKFRIIEKKQCQKRKAYFSFSEISLTTKSIRNRVLKLKLNQNYMRGRIAEDLKAEAP
ncbi:unnamed protein product [Vicia faba]|uniref:Uncharacterized protein n=1 Tax=Vicia faba TaxID=3906 RepID=A0AAV1BC42_VICFA|nr:unnamed protein product [Vicia faba]